MEKEEYLKKSKREMASDLANKIVKSKTAKGFKYKVDKKKLKEQLKKLKSSLGSNLAEKINFKAQQMGVKQYNKDNKGK